MAVVFIMDFRGGTREKYDAVIEDMELGGKMPEGGMFHAAGSYEGGWRVVDCWERPEQFERFRDEKIMPITAEHGLEPPQVRVVEVDQHRKGTGATPELVQVVMLPGLDGERFHASDEQILDGGKLPPSVTFHVNGPYGDGWCVVDGWDSKEARDRFIGERVRPVVESQLSGPPQIEDLTVDATLGEHATAHA